MSRRPILGMFQPGMPDIDVDFQECNLASLGETLEIHGEEYPVPSLNDYRYVVYDKQIQHVRNPDSFLTYHKKNTGSLEHLMTNLVWAQLLPEMQLESMYAKGRNQSHTRLVYNPDRGSTGNTYAFIGRMYSTRQVPFKPLLEKSQRWLQGIIIETHGAQGLDIIKRAKEKSADKFKIKAESFANMVEGELDKLREEGKPLGDLYSQILSSLGVPKEMMGIPNNVEAYVAPMKTTNLCTEFLAGHKGNKLPVK